MISILKYEGMITLESFDIGELHRILQGSDKLIPMLNVMHLLFDLRSEDVVKRSLSQEMARNYPHSLPVFLVQP